MVASRTTCFPSPFFPPAHSLPLPSTLDLCGVFYSISPSLLLLLLCVCAYIHFFRFWPLSFYVIVIYFSTFTAGIVKLSELWAGCA